MTCVLPPTITEAILHDNRALLDPRWKTATAAMTMPAHECLVWLTVRGYTEEYWPRFYFIHCRLDPDRLAQLTRHQLYHLTDTHIVNMIHELNLFLDPRCMCFPGADGFPGPPCPWHAAGHPPDWTPDA